MEGRIMNAFLISLVLYLASFIYVGVGLAAEGLGSPQKQTAGDVGVTVWYLVQTDHESKFSIDLDSHSIDLNLYDLKALSVLRDDTGLTMVPTGAENSGSGHHREVILTFSRPSLARKWLELVIKDVAGVKERVFRWDSQ